MFELFLVMITLFSPLLFIVLIRSYFSKKQEVNSDALTLLQTINHQQLMIIAELNHLNERLSECEIKK